MKDSMLVNQSEKNLACVLDASSPTSYGLDSWNSLCEAIYNKVVETFGFNKKSIPDWLKAHIDTVGPALDQKRMARLAYLNNPSMEILD